MKASGCAEEGSCGREQRKRREERAFRERARCGRTDARIRIAADLIGRDRVEAQGADDVVVAPEARCGGGGGRAARRREGGAGGARGRGRRRRRRRRRIQGGRRGRGADKGRVRGAAANAEANAAAGVGGREEGTDRGAGGRAVAEPEQAPLWIHRRNAADAHQRKADRKGSASTQTSPAPVHLVHAPARSNPARVFGLARARRMCSGSRSRPSRT